MFDQGLLPRFPIYIKTEWISYVCVQWASFNSVNEEPQQETGRRQGNGFINHGMRFGPFMVSTFFIFMLQFLKIKI